MSDEEREKLSFGEKLVGMQSLNSARAARYRADMEKILVHRLSGSERRLMGLTAVLTGTVLAVKGIAIVCTNPHLGEPGLDSARWTVGVTCIATGLLLGAWLLRIAIQGGYSRRLGDIVGLTIALVFAGGWAVSLVQLARGLDYGGLRNDLLSVGGVLLVIIAACLVIALAQRMHRQTQERLLRIEHQLAELLDRDAEAASP